MKKHVLSTILLIFEIFLFLFFALSASLSAQLKTKKQLNKSAEEEVILKQKGITITKKPVSIKLSLPQTKLPNLLNKSINSSQSGIVTILSEGFESDFPAGLWSVESGSYTWGKRNVVSHNGSNCAWAIGGGTNGSALSLGANYPNSMSTLMIYGPFDLSDANWAALSFYVSLNTESNYDYFSFMASEDGSNFYGWALSGTTNGEWISYSLALTAVPVGSDMKNYTGKSAVWIAFSFESDAVMNYPNGVFLDDVILQKSMVKVPDIISSFNAPGTSPRGLTYDGNNLWCSDATNDRIYKLSTSGIIITSFASPSSLSTGLAWDGTNLWNADANTDRLYKLNTSGSIISSFATPGISPSGLTWDGSNLWLSDVTVETIWKINSSGTIQNSISAPGTFHYGLAWDGHNIWLVDADVLLIYKMDTSGNILDYYLPPATYPSGLVWDGNYLWIADRDTYLIYKMQITTQLIANDVGVIDMNIPGTLDLGDSLVISVTIKNFGTSAQNNFPVKYSINNGTPKSENCTVPIAPGATTVKTFSNFWKPLTEGTYEFNAWTSLSGDENTTNDTLPDTKSIIVNRPVKDVGVTSVDLPDFVELGDSVNVKVVVNNFGTAQQNFPISYNINNGTPVTENFTDELVSGQSATKIFSKYWKPLSEGTYQFNAWSSLLGDENTSNDTLPNKKNVTVYKSINEPPAFKLYLQPDGSIEEIPYTQEYDQDVYVNGYIVEWQYPLSGDILGNSFVLNFIGGSQGINGTYFKAELLLKTDQGETSIATKEFFGSCFYTLPFYDIYPRIMTVELTGINPTAKSGDILLVQISVVSGAAGRIMYGTTVGDNYVKIPYASGNLSAPVQSSPTNNSINISINPELKWTSPNGATSYHLQVSTKTDFSTLLFSDSTLTNTSKSVGPLDYNTKYYWRVRAKNIAGSSLWSNVWNFKTINTIPGIPTLVFPANNSFDQPVQLNFNWNSVNYSEKYQLQLSTNDNFSSFILNDANIIDTQKTVNSLQDGMKYFWRVRANNSAGTGAWSAAWNFITQMFSPDSLKAEPNGVKNVKLTWIDNCSYETGFILERKLEPGGDYEILDSILANSTSYIDTSVQQETTYKYRLKAYNQFVNSAVSNEAAVTTLTSVNNEGIIPKEYCLYQNYPNPFNPSTTIKYDLPKQSFVTLKIYNSNGQKVETLVNIEQTAGRYQVQWKPNILSSGMYLYRLSFNGSLLIKKMIYLK